MSADRPSGGLGRKLRDARERKGVSLREISNRTKIAVAVLEGLEREDISKLPSGIFGRAFVRSFAIEVGLDPEASVQEFALQFRNDLATVGHPPSERIDENEDLERKRTSWRVLGVGALVAAAAGVATYLWLPRFHEGTAATAPRNAAAAADAGSGAASPVLQETSGAPVPAREPVSGDTTPAPAAAPERAADSGLPSDRITVLLRVSRPCWISAVVDGKRQAGKVLRPGEERTLEARNDFSLTVGDAGAVNMTINGAAAKAIGKSGEVVTIRLNLVNFASYLSAR
jgi:cytoskeleton protein RodZ